VHQIEAQLQTNSADGTGNQGFDPALLRLVQEGVVEEQEALHTATIRSS
jgi:Tfp pilus assembly ATPase PilU